MWGAEKEALKRFEATKVEEEEAAKVARTDTRNERIVQRAELEREQVSRDRDRDRFHVNDHGIYLLEYLVDGDRLVDCCYFSLLWFLPRSR